MDDDLVADGPSTGQMVEDTGALDCSVCYLPLKPPIFQCIHGHVVCDACHDKLKAAGKGRCAVCRVGIGAKGYIRCHAMERLVECVRGSCPHAAHGCPFKACGFAGSVGPLLGHLTAAHSHEEPVRRFLTQELRGEMRKLRLRVADEEAEVEAEMVPRDVDLVMSRATVSRDEAIRALKESGGDVVDAILELTSS